MPAQQHIQFDFHVTAHMVESFARLTGDYNSMHVNPEIARKSRYRQPVVHGMIPFSFIQLLVGQFSGQCLELSLIHI